MDELAKKLASSTGMSVVDVSRCLAELAKLAYVDAASGFVLPGFGKFRVVPGPETKGVSPFTGKTHTFRAPPEVEFIIDTKAKKAFIAGKAEECLSTSDEDAIESPPPIKLVPDAHDARAVGVDDEQMEKSAFKVGGEPDWLQAPEVPVCCGEPMFFYGQLDSLGGEYTIADMGRLYVFLCRSCSSSRSILQF